MDPLSDVLHRLAEVGEQRNGAAAAIGAIRGDDDDGPRSQQA